ncbi:MAG: hypothetical protein FJ368_01690 [Pelagibacterales bacterium]|nr:hypothetical protein [Pelagibacterales bacterium]
MKNKIVILLSIAALSLFSCSKKNTEITNKNNELSNLPSWVLDPEVEDGIGAVGIAGPSKGGLKFQIPIAELNAKGNIAAKVQSEISRVTKEALRSANVNNSDDVEEFFSQASKEVIKNQSLSGVKRVKDHIFLSKDGTLYIHMVLTGNDYSKFLQNSENKMASRIKKSDMARDNINKTEQANKAIFDELEKERSNKE